MDFKFGSEFDSLFLGFLTESGRQVRLIEVGVLPELAIGKVPFLFHSPAFPVLCDNVI